MLALTFLITRETAEEIFDDFIGNHIGNAQRNNAGKEMIRRDDEVKNSADNGRKWNENGKRDADYRHNRQDSGGVRTSKHALRATDGKQEEDLGQHAFNKPKRARELYIVVAEEKEKKKVKNGAY